MTGPMTLGRRLGLARTLKATTLGCVLLVAALIVPNSAVSTTDVMLVKVKHAAGVSVSPDITWILAVGSDARPGEDMTHSRGDALQLIGLNTKTGAAAAIGVPRDSWVSIPGYGSNKINSSLYFGGPQLLGETVGNLIGIQPDYVFVTRFPFFEDMINDIGGIHVDNPTAFADDNLKPNGFSAGRVFLNGYNAMAFSRIRHDLPAGDFARSANQQRVLRGIQSRVRSRSHESGFIERGVLTVMEHLYTDLPPGELFELAHAMAQIDPSKITSCVVQGGIGSIGGASVVLPYTDQAHGYGDDAREDAVLDGC